MNDYADKKCGDCDHWHKSATNPNMVEVVRGRCRVNPPSVTSIPQPNGSQFELANYPSVPPDFPACAQFQKALKIIGNHQQEEDQASEQRL